MKEFQYVIADEQGIHARPAGELVKLAKSFTSTVQLKKDEKSVDCKKIFGIMGLGIKKGQEVTFIIEGEDEQEACEKIQKFMQENL